MKKILLGLVLYFSLFCSVSFADMYQDYVEYRYQPKLGKITISYNQVRSEKYVDYLSENWKDLADRDIFTFGSYGSKESRVFKRNSVVDGYEIDTVLTVYSPAGMGMGGAYPTFEIQVFIDGKEKINSHIGYLPGGNYLVSRVTIHPNDEAIFVDAKYLVNSDAVCDDFIRMTDSEIVTDSCMSK